MPGAARMRPESLAEFSFPMGAAWRATGLLARALGSLQLEMDSRSLDLLLLTRLSAWRRKSTPLMDGRCRSTSSMAGIRRSIFPLRASGRPPARARRWAAS